MHTQSPITNRYGAIASEIYDLDKPPGKLPDTAFYLSRLAGLTGEILEPACGSGRMLVSLIEAGHRVAGFDPSPDMLDRCRARTAAFSPLPDLTSQSFESFRYDRRFAAIILPAGSFTLIEDSGAARRVLTRMRDHLAAEGRLLIDIMPLSALAGRADDRRRWTAPNGDLLTLEGIVTRTDWIRQTLERTYRYERWRGGVLAQAELDVMVQRHWGLLEFRLALEAAGFGEVSVHANYHAGAPPTDGTRILTFEARAV
jgi:SAM-dependent methyltransferase